MSSYSVDAEHFPYQLARDTQVKLGLMLEDVKRFLPSEFRTTGKSNTERSEVSSTPLCDLNIAATVLYSLICDWLKSPKLKGYWPKAEETINWQYNNICTALDTLSKQYE